MRSFIYALSLGAAGMWWVVAFPACSHETAEETREAAHQTGQAARSAAEDVEDTAEAVGTGVREGAEATRAKLHEERAERDAGPDVEDHPLVRERPTADEGAHAVVK